MELAFHSTKRFEKDLAKFPPPENKRVVEKLNRNCSLLQKDIASFYRNVHRPLIPLLKEGWDSTLYSMRIDRDIRILLTVDEDPLFDQFIITLMRVVRHDELNNAFKSIAESLYQKSLAGFSGDGGDDSD